MLYKSYQLLWVSIVKGFRCKSLKIGQNSLKFQPNLLKNCVNLISVTFCRITSEPSLENR